MNVSYIPQGYHTLTPYLVVKDAPALMRFLQQAFAASEIFRMTAPDGNIAHAEMQLGTSRLMLASASREYPATKATYHLYLPEVDAVYQQALAAGAVSMQEPKDQFYGDRTAGVQDGSGNTWYIATHIEDVAEEELQRRAQELYRAG